MSFHLYLLHGKVGCFFRSRAIYNNQKSMSQYLSRWLLQRLELYWSVWSSSLSFIHCLKWAQSPGSLPPRCCTFSRLEHMSCDKIVRLHWEYQFQLVRRRRELHYVMDIVSMWNFPLIYQKDANLTLKKSIIIQKLLQPTLKGIQGIFLRSLIDSLVFVGKKGR